MKISAKIIKMLNNDCINDPSDDNIHNQKEDSDNPKGTIYGGHPIDSVSEVYGSGEDEKQFEDPIASPSVIGEEDSVSGSASDGEPVDIDEALKEVGLKKDD